MITKLQQLKLNKIFKDNGVILAYVFGSYARGKITPLSDFDVAILFSKNVNLKDYFDRELKIAGEIGRVIKIDQIDVINLATVRSPLLKHEAVFEGKPVFVNDKDVRFITEKIIRQEYDDTEYLRETSYRILNRQIKEGTFGTAPIYVTNKQKNNCQFSKFFINFLENKE